VNIGILVLLIVAMSALLLLLQRSESKRRLLVLIILLLPAELLRRFILFRGIETEAWVALVVSLVLTTGYWLFIGRYNPVRKSDEEIRVFRMDD
jgi:hypothetical protein